MSRLLALVTLLPLTACVAVIGEKEDISLEGPVDSVVVDVEEGDVTVVAGSGDEILVERWVAESAGVEAVVSAELVDGTLHVEARCPVSIGWCSTDHHITVPADVTVDVRLASGDLSVFDVAGEVGVTTGSGDVDVRGVALVSAETGSGDVHVEDAADLWARTGSGDVSLDTATAIANIAVETGSGDVDLRLPAGAYALDVDTGSGDIASFGVQDGEGAPVWARTGSGDVTISAR